MTKWTKTSRTKVQGWVTIYVDHRGHKQTYEEGSLDGFARGQKENKIPDSESSEWGLGENFKSRKLLFWW